MLESAPLSTLLDAPSIPNTNSGSHEIEPASAARLSLPVGISRANVMTSGLSLVDSNRQLAPKDSLSLIAKPMIFVLKLDMFGSVPAKFR